MPRVRVPTAFPLQEVLVSTTVRRSLSTRLALALAGAAAIVAAPLATALPAQAHAELVGGDPKAGSAIAMAPGRITLTMSEDLKSLSGSHVNQIVVTDRDGKEVTTGETTIKGSTMSRALKPLPAGTYDVAWADLSVDGHRANSADDYAFTVTKGVAAGSGSASASAPASASASVSDAASSAPASSGAAVAGSAGSLADGGASASLSASDDAGPATTTVLMWVVGGFLVLAIILGIVLQATRRKPNREH